MFYCHITWRRCYLGSQLVSYVMSMIVNSIFQHKMNTHTLHMNPYVATFFCKTSCDLFMQNFLFLLLPLNQNVID